MFTKDHVDKLASDVTNSTKVDKSINTTDNKEERKGDPHFKSVLKELEENVSSDEEDENKDEAKLLKAPWC